MWTGPSSGSAYDLAFAFKGDRIVSFSIKHRVGVSNGEQEVLGVTMDGKKLALPITADSLTQMLGAPAATRQYMMWP